MPPFDPLHRAAVAMRLDAADRARIAALRSDPTTCLSEDTGLIADRRRAMVWQTCDALSGSPSGCGALRALLEHLIVIQCRWTLRTARALEAGTDALLPWDNGRLPISPSNKARDAARIIAAGGRALTRGCWSTAPDPARSARVWAYAAVATSFILSDEADAPTVAGWCTIRTATCGLFDRPDSAAWGHALARIDRYLLEQPIPSADPEPRRM